MGVLAIRCDVSRRDEVRKAVEFVRDRLGDANVLVNNAGIMHLMPFEEY
ncbi:MAG: SDR family NAD(P)-dependent oxidoreductase, partial [Vulcanisaeta sp.]